MASTPARPAFVITAPGEAAPAGTAPQRRGSFSLNNPGLVAPGFSRVEGDSPEAARFREAAVTVQERLQVAIGAPAARPSLNVVSVGEVLRFPVDSFERNPATLDPLWRRFSEGVYRLNEGLLVVLNDDSLLDYGNQAAA